MFIGYCLHWGTACTVASGTGEESCPHRDVVLGGEMKAVEGSRTARSVLGSEGVPVSVTGGQF